MSVRSENLVDGQRRPRRPGMIDGGSTENALIASIHVAAWLLIMLSVLGTFYGARNLNMPLTDPLQLARDIWATPIVLVLAIVGQGLLSVVQWGSRQLAIKDRRWWALYFGALALSAWWNWQAYGDPLVLLGVPWGLVVGIVIAGDMFPEFALVKE